MIEVTELTKKYGSHTAVENLSFRVEKGQIYGFLGPNGAGKSTTMNILTGYLGATSGKVLVNGYDMAKQESRAKRCIGYLPEVPPLYRDMTVLEYLRFAAGLKAIPKREREEQIRQVMDMTDVGDVKERLIRNLSKGYRQRVGLAQALLGFPEILILDEPMAGLDPKQIIEVRDLIRSLKKDHTVILSSHILSEVSAVCDHILIISEGRLMASDTPENLSRLSGENTLELTVKGDKPHVESVLVGVGEISAYEMRDLPNGECSVCVKYDKGQDVREAVFAAMARENLPILSMQTKDLSLEEVFLELTSQDLRAAAPAQEASDRRGEQTDTDGAPKEEGRA